MMLKENCFFHICIFQKQLPYMSRCRLHRKNDNGESNSLTLHDARKPHGLSTSFRVASISQNNKNSFTQSRRTHRVAGNNTGFHILLTLHSHSNYSSSILIDRSNLISSNYIIKQRQSNLPATHQASTKPQPATLSTRDDVEP